MGSLAKTFLHMHAFKNAAQRPFHGEFFLASFLPPNLAKIGVFFAEKVRGVHSHSAATQYTPSLTALPSKPSPLARMAKKAGPRLRDLLSWPPLAMRATSRNLGQAPACEGLCSILEKSTCMFDNALSPGSIYSTRWRERQGITFVDEFGC